MSDALVQTLKIEANKYILQVIEVITPYSEVPNTQN